MAWVRATTLSTLQEKPFVFRSPPLQIAIFQIDGSVFAIDNRCPHEGYPLASGSVTSNCVLTCNWHNWKFRLNDGACIVGGDDVRAYQVRMQDGEIWLDITPQPIENIREKTFRGLKTAFDERDFGRICREIARLHFHGLETLNAIREAIRWSYDRLEYGMSDTHAYAATADWLSLAEHFRSNFESRLICIAEAVDHMAFDSLRRPLHPYAMAGEEWARGGFLAAVEGEDTARAEGMVARALAGGLHWPDLEESFATAALAHYMDFGHSVIYVQKIGELLALVGQGVETELLLPMARQLCYATREDRIPEFKGYAAALTGLPDPRESQDTTEGLEVPFPMNLSKGFRWLNESLSSHSPTIIHDRLLTALSLNMLYFDASYGLAYDRQVSDNVSWLDFTHGITFGRAVRLVCTKYPHLWRPGLLQMACFLGRNHGYIDLKLEVDRWKVAAPADFFSGVHETLLDHGQRVPIFAVHLLKTSMAVEAELPFVSSQCGEALLAALNRFLHSPLKTKHVRRLARQAINLVSRDFE